MNTTQTSQETIQMVDNQLSVLGTKHENYSGDFVLTGQTVAAEEGFKHVSKPWYQQCMSFDKGLEVLAEQQKQIDDIKAPLTAWEPTVEGDKFVLKYKATGKCYVPTEHCLTEMAAASRMSSWQVIALMEPIRHATKTTPDGEKQILYRREKCDAECMVSLFKAHLFHPQRQDQNKTRLFRTWKNGSMRAFLSDGYKIVNNHWFLETLSKLIPGGLLSHWRGDADTIAGNILIPDTIREEKDSDYGGMLSVGNSEIGTRRISTLPSVYRSICQNGCIHNAEVGTAYDQIHRGEKVNYNDIFLLLKQNLQAQIPLLTIGIDKMLETKKLGMGDTPLVNMFAQLAMDYTGVTKKDVIGIAQAFVEESKVLNSTSELKTAFGLQSAITRYGQTLSDNDRWVQYDTIGGQIINLTRDSWDSFRGRAKNMRQKDLEKLAGNLLLAQSI